MKERVASYQVPKAIVWQSELPRNSMGKVQKTELLRALGESAAAAAHDGKSG
jgi:acyl-coenzyme A synthetase/AMP-(fatty) acid ligase